MLFHSQLGAAIQFLDMYPHLHNEFNTKPWKQPWSVCPHPRIREQYQRDTTCLSSCSSFMLDPQLIVKFDLQLNHHHQQIFYYIFFHSIITLQNSIIYFMTQNEAKFRQIVKIKKNTCPIYDQLGLERLKTNLIYNKFLSQLRRRQQKSNSKNKNKGSKQKEFGQTRFLAASTQIMSTIFANQQRECKLPQIKVTYDYAQSTISNEIIRISNKMDQHLESQLTIPKIQVFPDSEDNAGQQKIAKYDCFDKQLIDIIAERKFAKQGISLDLINKKNSKRIKKLALNQLKIDEIKDNQQKQNQCPLGAYSQMMFKSKGKTISKKISQYSKRSNSKFITNIQIEQFKKQQPFKKSSHINQSSLKQTSLNQQEKSRQKICMSVADLDQVLQNYKKKLQKYGGQQKYLMTLKRQQGILTNELLKIAKKFKKSDIMLSLSQSKAVKVQQEKDDKCQYQMDQQNIQARLSNSQLKKQCKSSFQYLNELKVEKL